MNQNYAITCRQCKHFVEVISNMTLRNPATGDFERCSAYHCNAFGLPIPTILKISCRYFEQKQEEPHGE